MGLNGADAAREWAVIALAEGDAALAARVAGLLPGGRVHVKQAPAGGTRIDSAVRFESTAAHLRTLFEAGTGIVAIAAAGIIVRALAPIIRDKQTEPPVLVMTSAGDAVVPLLGGHAAGANAIAVRLASALGARAALTTASEQRHGVALDVPPQGWRLQNPADHKRFAAALLEGSPVRLQCDEGLDPAWLRDSALLLRDDAEAPVLRCTLTASSGDARTLVYNPAMLALGVGCSRDTDAAELETLVRTALADAGLAAGAVAGVFSVSQKADEEAVHALARSLDVPCRFFSAERLEQERPRLVHPSEVVFAEIGCHGVAEGAALAAAGADAELVVPKRKTANATCAIARADVMIEAGTLGHARGELYVVGVGPGAPDYRAPAAAQAIRHASDVVGYGLYIDLVEDLLSTQTLHRYALGQETDRVRDAIALAASGRRVALVCSGDAGIYAMASLVCELLDGADDPAWGRAAVQMVPGISAMQLAAARCGALLGHDFCAISLSDLLTPREAIEQRLEAACAGDFVIALYNPISRQRVQTFERALAILRAHKAGDTVVVIARELGRPREQVIIKDLATLEAGDLDMLSIVLVGSSNSRTGLAGHRTLAYTPRGYHAPASISNERDNH